MFKLIAIYILLVIGFSEVIATQRPTPIALFEPHLLVSTLQGSLFSIGKRSGVIKWTLRDQPIVHLPLMPTPDSQVKIPLFLPDPKDGSLYRYNSVDNGGRDVLEKLPFTLSELVALSPCRSKDGLFYVGKKVDSWFAVNKETGEKLSLDSEKHVHPSGSNNENVSSDEKLLLVTKSEYQVSVYDLKTKQKIWNLTVFDFVNTANAIVDESHYDLILVSSSKSGRLVALDPISKEVLWSQTLGSSIVSVFEYTNLTPFGQMLQVPFLTMSEDYVSYPALKSMYDLHPSLYIGTYGSKSSYALTTLIDEDMTPIVSIKHLPLIEGPKVDNENESGEEFNSGAHSFSIIFPGFYEYPDYSKIEFSPMVSMPNSFVIDDEIDSNLPSEQHEQKLSEKPPQCANNKSDVWKSILPGDPNNTCENYDSDYPQIVIVSLWHWWREVLAISIVFAVLINVIVMYLKRKCSKMVVECSKAIEQSSETKEVKEVEEKSTQQLITNLSSETSVISVSPSRQSSSDFATAVSRFETDFEVIRRLGKGGYGLVLEARNRIDTCHYAIKIILLPMKAEAKEKVLREVKALAKLDHRGIVRFYNSWVEVPPANWEKASLKDWDNSEMSSLFASLLSNNNSLVNKASINETRGSDASQSVLNGLSFVDDDLKPVETTENDSYVVFESSVKKDKSTTLEDEVNEEISVEKTETKERPKSLLNNGRFCLFIQMQLCQKDTLREWLRNHTKRDRKFMYEVFVQIVNAVEYLHRMGLMHRDLKPSNIFFATDGYVKIGDFGLVTAASVDDFFHTPEVEEKDNIIPGGDEKHTNRVGTHLYMSPEQLRGVLYSNKVDIYSLGVIFFEMLVPFRTEMERITELQNVRNSQFPCDFKLRHSNECDFLLKLLSCDPNERPSAEDILQNNLFKEIDEHYYLQERGTRRRTLSSQSS